MLSNRLICINNSFGSNSMLVIRVEVFDFTDYLRMIKYIREFYGDAVGISSFTIDNLTSGIHDRSVCLKRSRGYYFDWNEGETMDVRYMRYLEFVKSRYIDINISAWTDSGFIDRFLQFLSGFNLSYGGEYRFAFTYNSLRPSTTITRMVSNSPSQIKEEFLSNLIISLWNFK